MMIAGIGARKTPEHVLVAMKEFARQVTASQKVWIRSGHADGADYAFECGAKERCIVYLPWGGFNHQLPLLGKEYALDHIDVEALRIVLKHEPHAGDCSNGVKLLKCRNVYQILSSSLCDPCDIVICWTENGRGDGGTGLAIKIAIDYGIPVIDLGKYETVTVDLIWELFNKHYPEMVKP